jgi:putative salt-induced outer membrane protein YdiY
MVRILWALIVIVLTALAARSEVVVFKNGDRLSGHWKSIKGSDVLFKSEMLGDVTIPIAKISAFAAPEPVAVVTKAGEIVHGRLSLSPAGSWRVTGPSTARAIPAQSVAAVIREKAYRQSVAERPAAPWRGWKTQTDFGFSVQKGEQQTRTTSIGINAVRNQPAVPGLLSHWRTNFNLNVLLASTESGGTRIGANTVSGSLRQDYLFGPHDFLFGLAQMDKIQSQDLNLRQTYGGGLGHDLVSRKRLDLSLLAGTTFVNAKFFGLARTNNIELLTGEKLGSAIHKGLRIDHYVNFYTNLSDRGQFRFDSNTSLSLKLNSRLSLNASVADYYTSTAPPSHQTATIGPDGTVVLRTVGPERNNLTLTTGVSISF